MSVEEANVEHEKGNTGIKGVVKTVLRWSHCSFKKKMLDMSDIGFVLFSLVQILVRR